MPDKDDEVAQDEQEDNPEPMVMPPEIDTVQESWNPDSDEERENFRNE